MEVKADIGDYREISASVRYQGDFHGYDGGEKAYWVSGMVKKIKMQSKGGIEIY